MQVSSSLSLRLCDAVEVPEKNNHNSIFPALDETGLLSLQAAIHFAKDTGSRDPEVLQLCVQLEQTAGPLKMAIKFAMELPPCDPPELLTEQEIAAIHLLTQYRCPLHRVLAVRLRSQNRDVLDPFLPLIKLLLSGLGKLPRVRQTLYHGMRGNLHGHFSLRLAVNPSPSGRDLAHSYLFLMT